VSGSTGTAIVGEGGGMSARGWVILLILCGAIFLEGVDVSMMGVALPAMQADLGMSTSSLQWVVSAYVLGYGGFMLLGGRAADLLGRRQMFLLWFAIFLVFSGLGGLATESWMLIGARFITGLAAAFMTPAGLSIITTSFPEGPLRNRAVLIYSGIAAAGFTLGLVVGGILTEVHWRWVFFAPVIVSAVILLLAMRFIPHDHTPVVRSGGFDLTGSLSITGAMLALVYGVVMSTEVAAWETMVALAIAGLLLLTFVTVERRSAAPLVRLGIFRKFSLVRSNLSAMLLSGSFAGFQFIAVLYLQDLRGWSPLETGLAMLLCGIDVILAPTLTPKLVQRFGTIPVILVGLVFAALAYAWFLRIDGSTGYVTEMLPTVIMIGLAFSFAYGPLTIAATEGICEEEQGLAGALLYTFWQFGAALGLAVVTMIKVSVTTDEESASSLLDGFQAGMIVPVIAAVLGAVVISFGLRSARGSARAGLRAATASD
jgi:MFS family permease